VRKDLLTSVVLIALGSGILVEALRMPRFERLGVNPYTVPGIVPGALGAVIAFFGVLMLARTVVAWRRGHAVPAAAVAAEPGSTPRVVPTLALTLGYAGILVGRLPFVLATFLFVLAFLVTFGWTPGLLSPRRRAALLRLLGAALLQAVLVAGAVTYVFERIFLVRLP
jgi:hypothetical protein